MHAYLTSGPLEEIEKADNLFANYRKYPDTTHFVVVSEHDLASLRDALKNQGVMLNDLTELEHH